MKKLAFVLAAAGLMTVAACDQAPRTSNEDADLSPLSAPAVYPGSLTPMASPSSSTAPVAAPEEEEEVTPTVSAPAEEEETVTTTTSTVVEEE